MGSTGTTSPKSSLNAALATIPKQLRSRVVASYLELKKRYQEARYDLEWDTSGLSAGKFCESVLRTLQHHLTGSSVPFGRHIPNFADECRKLTNLPKAAGLESLRVIVPRALVFLYTLRGKRGVGHVGGDVEANEIDATVILRTCDWVICELIRVFHGLSLEEAQAIVDAIAQRVLPDIWSVAGKKRVLRKNLSYKQQTLLLLYSEPESGIPSEDIFDWTEHSNLGNFRRDVFAPLHDERSVEDDRENELVYISPLGVREVEDRIIGQAAV